MWNKLVVTYEGTIDIKDSRMDTLIQEYENFKLQDAENIIDMETRFTRIVDKLAQLGKNYTRNEKNRRALKSLPPSWKVKVTTIKEMHNLNDYHIDNLFGNLRAYEEDNVTDIVVPEVEDKNKNMALKSILIDEDDNDEELNEELQNLDESEIALLTRQLRRVLQSKAQRYEKGFLKSNNQQRVFNSNGRPNYSQNYTPNYKSNYPTTGYNKGKVNQSPNAYNHANNNHTYTPPKPKEQNLEEVQVVCFECKQPGHFKRECPKLSKGRILVAENGWDLSEDEEISETNEEVVNLCLMALEDDSSSSDVFTSNDENKTQEEELSRIKDLNLKNEEEISSLCEQNDILKNENNRFKDIIMRLEVENVSLVLQTEELENEKLQLNEENTKLHIDLLNLKIQNESLIQEKSTSVSQKDNLELVHALKEKDRMFELETQKLKDEHSKNVAHALDQERILNDKLNTLIKENENLEVVVQRFIREIRC
ncbi:uncharacterized protein LOC135147189 [Daucus carota subsp. sativus]|uniref:uncharacterized protein LOC135147189 n=1 Tax=Daucus carota subsp. sativus TaxID=79200 RepID=UPI003082D54A